MLSVFALCWILVICPSLLFHVSISFNTRSEITMVLKACDIYVYIVHVNVHQYHRFKYHWDKSWFVHLYKSAQHWL